MTKTVNEKNQNKYKVNFQWEGKTGVPKENLSEQNMEWTNL